MLVSDFQDLGFKFSMKFISCVWNFYLLNPPFIEFVTDLDFAYIYNSCAQASKA